MPIWYEEALARTWTGSVLPATGQTYDDHVPQVGLFVPLALGWADQILADLQKL